MCILSAYSAILRQTAILRPILLLNVLVACLLFPGRNAEAYTLKIYSYPSNAKVFIDGEFQGSTPLTTGYLKKGIYSIRLEKAGYEDYKTRAVVTHDATFSYSLKPLSPKSQSLLTVTSSHVLKLMQKANEYFNKKWYLTPEATNAFGVYKEILSLHPSHKLARERILAMMNQYKVWGDNNYDDGDYEKAAIYYERYMLIADYVLNTLQDQSILPAYQEIESRLAQAQNPPTPTPLPTVTPKPSLAPDVEIPFADLIQRPGKLYVVLIGIEAYQDARLPQRPGLANAAQQLYELFHAPSSGGLDADQLQLLLNEDATARNVKRVLGTWLRRRVTETDKVMLFYGGYAGVEDEEGYWLSVETQAEDLFSTALSYCKIAEMLTRLESKHLLLLLDACAPEMSEQPPARDNLTEMLQDKINAGKLMLLNASGNHQCAPEPFFSAAIVQGLEGQADQNGDGVIDLEEVWDYLKIKVIQRSLVSGDIQIPQKIGTALPHFPLTYKRTVLQAQFLEARFQRRVEHLLDLYHADDISATQFEKAFVTLQARQHDQILEDFLDGKLSLEIFQDIY